jgi:hypothetical protein
MDLWCSAPTIGAAGISTPKKSTFAHRLARIGRRCPHRSDLYVASQLGGVIKAWSIEFRLIAHFGT